MKKLLLVLFPIFLIFTGCSGDTKTMTCTKNTDQNDLKLDFMYTIQYKGTVVEKVKSTEKIISTEMEMLKTYKKNIETIYKPYKKVKHYTYNISIRGDVLTSRTTIDYTKIDTAKILEIDPSNRNIIKNGKIDIEDIKSTYETLGATCKKE